MSAATGVAPKIQKKNRSPSPTAVVVNPLLNGAQSVMLLSLLPPCASGGILPWALEAPCGAVGGVIWFT